MSSNSLRGLDIRSEKEDDIITSRRNKLSLIAVDVLNNTSSSVLELRQENAGLKLESASIKAQRDAVQAHTVFAGQQVAVYKHRYNSKVNKKESSKKVTTSARVLTSREVRKEIEQDAAKKVQKQKLEAERETRKAEAEKANII
ncbi:hypothetical protein GGU11DRAFT_744027 [Lentinula aff. detonsa]|uniref:Uncharacterized protein n=1 Tax=Lentinula aff. detonsa TaxID=2804958 RepID=A0AA38L5Y4_9AGAR|nr:hypothetical protein GGU10DRAFT_375121 [Lentinula aff. detonsa]KAJ3798753.1 hypothetical protein GGU11DRAFT_744027 [Lentinula aff. detonsa]